MRDEFREMVRRGGALAPWRGLGVTWGRDVPFSAVYWYAVEALRSGLGLGDAASGGVAGVLASVVTTPMDVVKTRMQVELGRTIITEAERTNGAVAEVRGGAPAAVSNNAVEGEAATTPLRSIPGGARRY